MSIKNLWIGLMAWSIRLPAAPRAILSVVTGLVFLSFVSAALILPVMAENRLGVQGGSCPDGSPEPWGYYCWPLAPF
jgi:hypothetical protein